jgi:hypothetical protein
MCALPLGLSGQGWVYKAPEIFIPYIIFFG